MAHEMKRIEVEFVLQSLQEAGETLRLHISRRRYRALLTDFNDDTLTLSWDAETPPERGTRATAFFSLRDKRMTFSAVIKSSSQSQLVLSRPQCIYRDLTRGFERVTPPADFSVTFSAEGEEVVLSYPKTLAWEPDPEPVPSPGFDARRIADLLAGFRQTVARYASENKIVMFRERKPAILPERLITASGRSLLLPFADSFEQAEHDPAIRRHLLDADDVERFAGEDGLSSTDIVLELQQHSAEQSANGIAQEIYAPVVFRQYVVGYVYAFRDPHLVGGFSHEAIRYIVDFTRILANSLNSNGYFEADSRPAQRDAEIIDISGSGMQFAYSSSGPQVHLYSDMDLKISTGEREIPMTARVQRKFQDSGRIYLGIQFLQLSQEDEEILLKALYGEEFTGIEDHAFDGIRLDN